jgi:hypothetical protein
MHLLGPPIDGSVAKNILQYIAIQYILQNLVQNVLSGCPVTYVTGETNAI